ncbi:uncharacterized protein LOC121877548 [Homarus americanus]|uniref:uncharacterized protein LOC121877548 n=1 Tax=Homarus americanus TaxID=6706 RepID=UPI001C48E8D0|nr:uncharacterized protein LOC121877548 [Homarus americanus]
MHRRPTSTLLMVCWAAVLVAPESAVSSPLPQNTFDLPPITASEVELQRVAVSNNRPELTPSALTEDFSDAIYAGRFAKELVRLERSRNPVYVNFIYSGFIDSEIPRDLPSDLQQLSRTPASPIAGPRDVTFPGARGARSRPSAQIFSLSPTVLTPQRFVPQVGVDRRAFVQDTRARGFPFARRAGPAFAK